MAASNVAKLQAYRDRLALKYQGARSKLQNKLEQFKADQELYKQRTESAFMHTAVAGGTAAILGYGLEAFPKAKYLDKAKKIETHALLAIALPVAGGAAYVAGVENGELVMQAGITAMSTFIFKKASEAGAKRAAKAAAKPTNGQQQAA